MTHAPRRNSLVVSAWQRERVRRAASSISLQAALWLISPEPTNPGRPSPRAEKHPAGLTTGLQTGKPRSPAPATVANPTIARSSLLSALTVPNNHPSRMLKKSSGVRERFRLRLKLRGGTSDLRSTLPLTSAYFRRACPQSFSAACCHVHR